MKQDCTKALELKPKYAKALLRRARALEHCNELETALEDVTAACILGGFSNQTALSMADRVLKQLGNHFRLSFLFIKKRRNTPKYTTAMLFQVNNMLWNIWRTRSSLCLVHILLKITLRVTIRILFSRCFKIWTTLMYPRKYFKISDMHTIILNSIRIN